MINDKFGADVYLTYSKVKGSFLYQSDESSKTATDKFKTGFHYLMDGITKALTVDPEDTSPPKGQPTQPDGSLFDRSKVKSELCTCNFLGHKEFLHVLQIKNMGRASEVTLSASYLMLTLKRPFTTAADDIH